ncbi:archaetidylserine decarboxylase [Halomonadaceae bacterium KBTZ08]
MPNKFLHQLSVIERLNFLLTNRIPRRWATRFMGWFSRIRQPLVRRVSMVLWQAFAGDLRLDEARKDHFESMHECFIRELRPGARPVDERPGVLVSPCDGIVGAFGPMRGTEVFQAKGFPYALEELLGDAELARRYADGCFLTLRLTASMYHRFHAPEACHLRRIHHIAGDTWNVNPIALKRIERLFCRNERAVLELALAGRPNCRILMVPVAAILVASLRLHALKCPLGLRYDGPDRIPCDVPYQRGEEMGYFEQGSTILLFTGPGSRFEEGVATGAHWQMGEAIMRY